MSEPNGTGERRRAGRFNMRLWTRIVGVDADWQQRRTNISVTGIFVEMDREVGDPGSVQELCLMAPDKVHEITVMSRVVRVFSTNDIWRGHAVAGVAFDFMVPTAESRLPVEALVRHLFGTRAGDVPSDAPAVQFTYAATVGDKAPVTVQNLGVNGMVLETSWPAVLGEIIRCEIRAPASKQTFYLEGEVINTVSELHHAGAPPSYQVQVRFRALTGAAVEVAMEASSDHVPLHAAGISIGDAIDALLEEAVFKPSDNGFAIPNEHLRGQLTRIRVPSLLGFFELEKLTGVLRLTHGATAALYLKDGRVIDCDPPRSGMPPLTALQEVMAWQEGTFEFLVADVERPDVIGMSTTHLLLRFATEADETL